MSFDIILCLLGFLGVHYIPNLCPRKLVAVYAREMLQMEPGVYLTAVPGHTLVWIAISQELNFLFDPSRGLFEINSLKALERRLSPWTTSRRPTLITLFSACFKKEKF